jgi:hypothetical protein
MVVPSFGSWANTGCSLGYRMTPAASAHQQHKRSPWKHVRLSWLSSWNSTSSPLGSLLPQPSHWAVLGFVGRGADALDLMVSIEPPLCGPGPGVRQHLRGHFLSDASIVQQILDLRYFFA